MWRENARVCKPLWLYQTLHILPVCLNVFKSGWYLMKYGITTSLLTTELLGFAASIFGELYKLEPLFEDNKQRWSHGEEKWIGYFLQLIAWSSKLDGKNGRSLEVHKLSCFEKHIHSTLISIKEPELDFLFDQILTLKACADIYMNLPAHRKLDSMTMTIECYPSLWSSV